MYWYTNILMYYDVLIYWCTAVSMCWYTDDELMNWCTDMLMYWSTDLLIYWCDVLMYWFTDVLIYWCTGRQLTKRCSAVICTIADVLMYWCTVVLMHWCTGAMQCCCTAVLWHECANFWYTAVSMYWCVRCTDVGEALVGILVSTDELSYWSQDNNCCTDYCCTEWMIRYTCTDVPMY
jgi:hypothetical protein